MPKLAQFCLTVTLTNGVDHLEAQDDLLPILEDINKKLDNGKMILQYNMKHYVESVQSYINEKSIKLDEHKGELRYGNDFELLKGTLSSRHYLKVSNVKAQNLLEQKLEPLYAMMEYWGLNGIYSRDHFRYMWKKLLQNHPHDSICGCSIDEVHKHMEDNFERFNEFAGEYLRRGMEEALYHIEKRDGFDDQYIILIANTIGLPMSGVIDVTLAVPKVDNLDKFTITDSLGNPVPYAVRSHETKDIDVFSPINLPGRVLSDVYHLNIFVENIPSLSMKKLIVKKSGEIPKKLKLKTDDEPVFQNEFLRVSVGKNGSISITDLKSERTAENCIFIEDTADRGDSYVYFKTDDTPVYSSRFVPLVKILEKNDYNQKCRIEFQMELPAYYDFKELKRSERSEISTVCLTLTLEKGSRILAVEYEIQNRSKDHRLRLVISSDILNSICFADTPFDIIKRRDNHYANTMSKVYPNTSFAVMEDGNKGIAVFTEGAHEFEQLNENQLAFTILRATGVINRSPTLEEGGGDVWKCPGNQCIRTISGRIGILLYDGNYLTASIPLLSLAFRNPVLVYSAPQDRKKFSGGRPAVQDSDLEEYFYLPDQYLNGMIPDCTSLIDIKGRNILISALKKSEDGMGLILRLFNFGNDSEDIVITVKGRIYKTDMSEEAMILLGQNSVSDSLPAKGITTFKIIK